MSYNAGISTHGIAKNIAHTIDDFNYNKSAYSEIEGEDGGKIIVVKKTKKKQSTKKSASIFAKFLTDNFDYLKTNLNIVHKNKLIKIINHHKKYKNIINKTLPGGIEKFKESLFEIPKERREDVEKLLNINDRIFGFIHGDSFVSSSGLEGGTISENIDFLLPYLEEKAPLEDKENIITLLTEAKELNYELLTLQKEPIENIEKLSEILKQRIEELQIGEKVLIPGGWLKTKNGHAIFYIVERNIKSRFSFTCINTGSGIGNHLAGDAEMKQLYKPLIRLKNVNEDRIKNQSFWRALCELQVPSDKHGAQDLYERIIPSLNGTRDSTTEDQIDFITDQRSGSCSWKVIMKLLQIESKNNQQYKKFNFELRRDSLYAYCRYLIEEDKEITPTQIQLLKRSNMTFSNSVLKLHKQKIISDVDLEEATRLAQTISKQIKQVLKTPRKGKAPLCFEKGSALSNIPLSPKLAIIHQPSQIPVSKIQTARKTSINPIFFPLDHTLEELNTHLKEVQIECQKQLKAQSPQQALEIIENLVVTLPLVEDSFWTDIMGTTEEIHDFMSCLEEISSLYIQSVALLPKDERGTPDQITLMFVLTILNNNASSQLDETIYPLAGSFLFSFNYFLSQWENDLYAILDNPGIYRHMVSAKRYMENFRKSHHFEINQKNVYYNNELFYVKNELDLKPIFDRDGRFVNERLVNERLVMQRFCDQFLDLIAMIRNPSFKQNLLEVYPELEIMSDFEITKELFSQFDSGYLPHAYKTLFRQNAQFAYFFRNPTLDFPNFSGNAAPGHIEVETITTEDDPESLKLNIKISGDENYYREYGETTRMPPLRSQVHQIPDMVGYTRILYNVSRMLKRIARQEVPNRVAMTEPEVGLSFEETKELGLVIANREIAPVNALGFLQEHSDKLLDRNMQIFFYHTFLAGSYLDDLIQSSPAFKKKFYRFIRESITLHKNLGNIQVVLYLLNLRNIVKKRSPEGSNSIKLRKDLRAVIKNIKTNSLEGKRMKALALVQVVASFHDEESFSNENDLLKAVKAYSFIKAYGFDSKLCHPNLIKKMHKVVEQMSLEVKNSDEDFKFKVLKTIAAEVLGIKGDNWSFSAHLFRSLDGEYEIDPITFTIFKNGAVMGSIPQQFIANRYFQALFRDEEIRATHSSPGVFQFTITDPTTSISSQYQTFISKATGEVVIQKKIGIGKKKKWCSFIPEESLYRSFPIMGLLKGHYHWLIKPKGSNPQLFIEEKRSMKISALVNLKIENKRVQVKSCCKINPGEPDDKAKLQNIMSEKSTLDQLTSFQPREVILVWGDKSIEFSDLGVAFDIQTDGKIIYRDNPSLQIEIKQSPPITLNRMEGYLKMSTEKLESVYLIPRQPLEEGKGALKWNVDLTFKEESGRYFLFTEKNGHLKGNSPEENLYLAYLHLAHKNYKEAYTYLDQKLAGNPKGYTERETQILNWMLGYLKDTKDSSPEAIAILMKISALYLRNKGFSNKESQRFHDMDSVSSNITKYYSIYSHIKPFRLSPIQELSLLETIRNRTPLQQRRYDLIKQKPSEPIPKIKKADKGSFFPKLPRFEKLSESLENKRKKHELLGQTAEIFHYEEGESTLATNFIDYVEGIFDINKEVKNITSMNLSLLRINDKELKNLRDFLVCLPNYIDSAPVLEELLKRDSEQVELEVLKELCKIHRELYKSEGDTRMSTAKSNIQKKTVSLFDSPFPKQQKNIPDLQFQFPDAYGITIQLDSVEDVLLAKGIELLLSPNTQIPSTTLLDKLTTPEGASPAIEKEFLWNQLSVEKNDEELSSLYEFEIGDNINIEKMSDVFEATKNELSSHANFLKENILELVNKKSLNPVELLREEMKFLGNKKFKISFDEILVLFLQNNGEKLRKYNPHLTEDEVSILTQQITNCLLYTTEADVYKRLEKTSKKLIKETDSLRREKLTRDLNNQLLEKRQYDPKVDPAMLVFEHFSRMRLRGKQVAIIKDMALGSETVSQNLITQLIMGSGKSKVILPLLAYLNSRGDNIPIIVVPDELYETNVSDMLQLSGELLKQEVETLSLPVDRALTVEDLDDMLAQLNRIKSNRSFCVVKSTMLHTLHLHFKDMIKNGIPDENKYERLKNIMNQIRKEGDAIIDEADLVLDCTKEVNFSGGTIDRVPKETQETIESLFFNIAKDRKLRKFLMLDKESEKKFDKETYEGKFKELLVDKFLEGIDFSKFGPSEQQDIKRYLLCDPDLEAIPKVILEGDQYFQDKLALGKELFKTLIPLILTKKCNEHFGLSKISGSNIAIPYSRSNTPSEGSMFSNHYETMLYTLVYYTRQGVKPDQIRNLISQLKAQSIAEFEAKGIPLRKTKGYKKFRELNISQSNLFTIQDSEIKGALKQFNKKLSNKITFAKQFGWSEMEIAKERLPSHEQHLVGMFNSVNGFTGTLWNKDTYPSSLNPLPDESADGKTLELLHRKKAQLMNFSSGISKLIRGLRGYQALIDVGAWFRGIDGRESAETILEKLNPSFKAVVYINDVDTPKGSEGKAVALVRGRKEPILLDKCTFSLEERFTYYNVTTGIDIPQEDLAKAMVTISKNTTIRDLAQGVWRMRGLDANQHVDFAIMEELSKDLAIEKEEVDVYDLMRFCIQNQGVRQQEDNLKAAKHKISFLLENVIETALLDPNLRPERALKLSKKVKKLLTQTSSTSPFHSFGGVDVEMGIQDVIESYIRDLLGSAREVFDEFSELPDICPLEQLEEKMKEAINYDLLPEKVIDQSNRDYGQTTQVKKKARAEQKSKTRTQTKIEVQSVFDNRNIRSDVSEIQGWRESVIEKKGLYSKELWQDKGCAESCEVYNYLQKHVRHEGVLRHVKKSERIYDQGLRMTRRFYAVRPNDRLGGNIIAYPFQKGSKSVDLCALCIDNDDPNNMNLYFLSPEEGAHLWEMLSQDREHVTNPSKDSKLKQQIFNNLIKVLKHIVRWDKSTNENIDRIDEFLEKFCDEIMTDTTDDYENYKANLEDRISEMVRTLKKIFNTQLYGSQSALNPSTLLNTVERDLDKNLKRYLKETKKFKPGDHKLVLVHPEIGVVQQGKDLINERNLKENKTYIRLMSQAKFFKGIVNHYSGGEKKALKEWILSNGVEKMENHFLNDVLYLRPRAQKLYQGSALEGIFQEIYTQVQDLGI